MGDISYINTFKKAVWQIDFSVYVGPSLNKFDVNCK